MLMKRQLLRRIHLKLIPLFEEETVNPFLLPTLWESNGQQPLADIHTSAATAAAADKSILPKNSTMSTLDVSWVAGENENRGEVAPLQFLGWQWTSKLDNRVQLATSGKISVPDGYGDDGVVDDAVAAAGGTRRRRMMTTSEQTKARVRDLLATRPEEPEVGGYGVEDMAIDDFDLEQI